MKLIIIQLLSWLFDYGFPAFHEMDTTVGCRDSASLNVVVRVVVLLGVVYGIYVCLVTIDESPLVFSGCQNKAAQHLAFCVET